MLSGILLDGLQKTKDSISPYSPTSVLLILKSVKSREEVAGGEKEIQSDMKNFSLLQFTSAPYARPR